MSANQIEGGESHVLLIEDNDVSAMVASSSLTEWSLSVARSKSIQEGKVAALKKERPLLILMTCSPRLDGVLAAREIRSAERRAALNQVPIIAVTADDTHEFRQTCVKAGMNDVLIIPFTHLGLFRAISGFIDCFTLDVRLRALELLEHADGFCDDPYDIPLH